MDGRKPRLMFAKPSRWKLRSASMPVTLWQRSQLIPAAPREGFAPSGAGPPIRRQNLFARAVDQMIIAQRADLVRPEIVQRACKLGHLALRRILTDGLNVGIVAAQTESSLHLIDVGKRLGAGQIASQRRAVDCDLGAIAIDRAEQSPGQEIRRNFQAIHQRTDVAVTRLDGAAQLIILPLVAGKACFRALIRLWIHRLYRAARRGLARYQGREQYHPADRSFDV